VVVVRRLGTLAATLVVAVVLGHVFLSASVNELPLGEVLRGTPAWIGDVLGGNLGETGGGNCPQTGPLGNHEPLCASYAASTVSDMLRERVPIDVSLLLGGLLVGIALGVAVGRHCATHSGSPLTRVLHLLTAFQLSTPVFFLALLVIYSFSSNVTEFVRLPFLSGSGDYVPFSEDPIGYVKAMWIPWLLAGLPLAAFLARLTESTLREQLQEDYVRTARAKGLRERQIVDRHALPVVTPALAMMAGVNVSTLLLNVAVIEYAYSIPGMFRVIYTVARERDVPVMEAMIVEGVILIVLANFIADAVQYRLDPRLERRPA
jgi:peptide/nickel transport system permease protein